MRFPRNVKMLRGPVDTSAMAGTLFLLWVVTLLHSSLVLPSGIRLNLPFAPAVMGEVLPNLSVAVDPTGRWLFEQQLVTESNLFVRLRERVATGGSNQTLLVLLDRTAPTETLARLVTLARASGVGRVLVATSPRPGTAASGAVRVSGGAVGGEGSAGVGGAERIP